MDKQILLNMGKFICPCNTYFVLILL